MLPTLIAQGIILGVIFLELAFLTWRYHVTVSRPVRVRMLRQKFYALRDQIIWLVAENKASEKDPEWQTLYKLVNAAASAASVVSLNSLSTAGAILRAVGSPRPEPGKWVQALSGPLAELWIEFILALLSTVRESLAGRLALSIAIRSLAGTKQQSLPAADETRYHEWERAANELSNWRNTKPPISGTCTA
jgi:hypothetical protein